MAIPSAAASPSASASSRAKPAPSAKSAVVDAGAPVDAAAPTPPKLACPLFGTWIAGGPKLRGDRPYKIVIYADGRISSIRQAGAFAGSWRGDGTTIVVADTSAGGDRMTCATAVEGRYSPQFKDACQTMTWTPLFDDCGERKAFLGNALYARDAAEPR